MYMECLDLVIPYSIRAPSASAVLILSAFLGAGGGGFFWHVCFGSQKHSQAA